MEGLCLALDRVLLILILLLIIDCSSAMCPYRCSCNDDQLRATCINAGLEVVPIQLNPEAKHINLSQNKINNVHFTLSNYNNLITLDLSSNKIKTLGSGNFEAQHYLKKLNLSNNELKNLTKDTFKGLRSLIELDLSLNHLEELHAHSFRDIFALELLILTGNQLIWLEPELLRPATRLTELILEDNELLEIPGSALGEANFLRKLSLSGNLIRSVEETLPPLPSLKVLLLSSNVINDIHQNALSGLPALEYLDLSDNNFTSVPTKSLAKLFNLTTLQLSGNLITTIPPVAFRGLFQLRYMYLDRLEKLVRIDSRAFVDNINIENIWMDDNLALSAIPTRLFHGNPHVVKISIRNNSLSTLEASHFPLDQLRTLRLSANPFMCNCSLLWLWRLEHEQLALNSSETDSELFIDSDGIYCAGPEPLQGMLLLNVSESQIICTLNWFALILGLTLLIVSIFTILLALYLRRYIQNRKLSGHQSASCKMGRLDYDHSSNDKYIMESPQLYRTLPLWENTHNVDIYRQFDITKSRPHIVYV